MMTIDNDDNNVDDDDDDNDGDLRSVSGYNLGGSYISSSGSSYSFTSGKNSPQVPELASEKCYGIIWDFFSFTSVNSFKKIICT